MYLVLTMRSYECAVSCTISSLLIVRRCLNFHININSDYICFGFYLFNLFQFISTANSTYIKRSITCPLCSVRRATVYKFPYNVIGWAVRLMAACTMSLIVGAAFYNIRGEDRDQVCRYIHTYIRVSPQKNIFFEFLTG